MVTIEIIVWIFGTFDYNLEMKNAFISYLKESCLLFSVAHFSFYLIVCYNMESFTKVFAFLTLMLLLANMAKTKRCKKPEKWLKPWQMGTHLKALRESYPMSTNMTGFGCFSKIFVSLCFGRK